MLKLFYQEQGKAFKGLEDIFKDETLEDIYDNRLTDGDKHDITVDVAEIPIRYAPVHFSERMRECMRMYVWT